MDRVIQKNSSSPRYLHTYAKLTVYIHTYLYDLVVCLNYFLLGQSV